MANIHVLDPITIDKIAAGEVIERPASIVKELVENSIDAGATGVTVEIQDGGISFIRITDNGSGIARDDVQNAFLRHSTSKIRGIDDLVHVASLGFRGEALSSIAAVAQVELITKTAEETFGTKYQINGGKEQFLEETGAPNGTTFMIRQLFYNMPARRKFLKTPMTEASHINDLLMHLSLSHPEVSFRFLNNGQEKLRTSGNGNLKDVIYNIYGREVAGNLIQISYDRDNLRITGFLGKPIITRGNRNFENFFFNGRYVKSAMVSKAAEDAYKDFVMQHKFPFLVLHFTMDGEDLDVNVHPTKMELRFHKQQEVYNCVYETVHRALLEPELIPQVELPDAPKTVVKEPSPFLLKPRGSEPDPEILTKTDTTPVNTRGSETSDVNKYVNNGNNEEYFMQKMRERVLLNFADTPKAERALESVQQDGEETERALEISTRDSNKTERTLEFHSETEAPKHSISTDKVENNRSHTTNVSPSQPLKNEQLDLFEEKLLTKEARTEYTIIGQLFDTYWLVQFRDNLYIIDQHAAHERVLYERTLREMKTRSFTSQNLSPPIILNLSMAEEQVLNEHMDQFARIGFEIEPFGGDAYAVRAVPDNLFGIASQDLLTEMLDGLADGITTNMKPDLVDEKVASMSCKAAVKGNNRLSMTEVDTLINELLELENPYHCPHGRPTIIAMSKRELEKKFKRIV
ncbi:DNA mismatch repair endonuclease MutL [Hespellia stercorisuis]|uniref:DNA mismatch repair protein MutL n=1 Tax=Hespellia stercorisuis DSM 15480 TaxID=1121950 RepID=A0A1M6N469_9FIRM|nr:DNA mismatch repair endonuclease MutL [Hespellia stercorisuis]SHJ90484.1 DNA mismatch repair protein MutL [Hespellia stercorisuis DSM 15480]